MSEPFNAEVNTGRMAYRQEWEQADGRPVIVYVYPFWANETERLVYEDAVEANPIQDTEYRLAYLQKISEMVLAKYGKHIGLPKGTEIL